MVHMTLKREGDKGGNLSRMPHLRVAGMACPDFQPGVLGRPHPLQFESKEGVGYSRGEFICHQISRFCPHAITWAGQNCSLSDSGMPREAELASAAHVSRCRREILSTSMQFCPPGAGTLTSKGHGEILSVSTFKV